MSVAEAVLPLGFFRLWLLVLCLLVLEAVLLLLLWFDIFLTGVLDEGVLAAGAPAALPLEVRIVEWAVSTAFFLNSEDRDGDDVTACLPASLSDCWFFSFCRPPGITAGAVLAPGLSMIILKLGTGGTYPL